MTGVAKRNIVNLTLFGYCVIIKKMKYNDMFLCQYWFV